MVVDHPLVQHKLSVLRDIRTGPEAVPRAREGARDADGVRGDPRVPLAESTVTTPITETKTRVLAGKKVAVVPILRAGLGMVDGILTLIPAAKVGHIGLYRDPETLEPVEYYCKLPEDIGERDVMIVDPMLATGGSAAAAIGSCASAGAQSIRLLVAHRRPGRHRGGRARRTATCRSTSRALDSHLNDTATSCRASATPATGSSGHSR